MPRIARWLPGDRVIPDRLVSLSDPGPGQIRHACSVPEIQNHPETNPAHQERGA